MPVCREVAKVFAINLRDSIDERSVRAISEQCNVSHATVLFVLSGEAYADLASIARLEQGLNTNLWPALRLAPAPV